MFPAGSSWPGPAGSWEPRLWQRQGERGALFADMGPAPDTEADPAAQSYKAVAEVFLELGCGKFPV